MCVSECVCVEGGGDKSVEYLILFGIYTHILNSLPWKPSERMFVIFFSEINTNANADRVAPVSFVYLFVQWEIQCSSLINKGLHLFIWQ